MPEKYTMSQAAGLLGIDRRTLYNWLQSAGVDTGKFPTDARVKALTMAQITRIAAKHGKTINEASDIERMEAELETLRAQVETQQGQIGALEGRVHALERQPSTRPSIGAIDPPARPQSHTGLSSGPAVNPADLADTLKLPRMPSAGAISKADATRLIAERHGVAANTAKGWPWPAEALVSADAALRWALSYVARMDTFRRPRDWRWRCAVQDCPCQQAEQPR